jgi:23S rRNA pseudouridine2605 synthase
MTPVAGADGDDSGDDGLVRLQRHLAQSGVASRRRCEELMLAGLVEVDGEVVTRLGTKIDPRTAVVRVEGRLLPPVSDHVYLALHKPAGVVSTMADPHGRRTLSDLIADRPERLFHVGRLDTDTEGLILLTNDGDLAHRVAHPSYKLEKTYVAEVEGVVSRATMRRLREGVAVDGRVVGVHRAKVVQPGRDRTIVELTIHEGRNRVVRRVFDQLGHPVRRLTRTVVGPVRLRGLRPGEHRPLTREELGVLLDLGPAGQRGGSPQDPPD